MKLGDVLFFSPTIRFKDIDWGRQETVISAFEDRLFGYFLKPAAALEASCYGFGQCLLIIASVEFLANFMVKPPADSGRKEFLQVLQASAPEFSKRSQSTDYRRRFYESFRNGLVHNGCIKGLDQLSYDLGSVVELSDNVMTVNPRLLQKAVEGWAREFIKGIRASEEARHEFMLVMKHKFSEEINRSRTI